MDEIENFFLPIFLSGMGGYTSKCEKSQNHCTLMGSEKLLKDIENHISTYTESIDQNI